jgi:hypothetical protein
VFSRAQRKKKAAVLALEIIIRIVNAKTRANKQHSNAELEFSLLFNKEKKKNSESREALLYINYIIIHFLVVFKRYYIIVCCLFFPVKRRILSLCDCELNPRKKLVRFPIIVSFTSFTSSSERALFWCKSLYSFFLSSGLSLRC